MSAPGSQRSSHPVFRSPAARAGFDAAYDAVLAKWPVPHRVIGLRSAFGRTHVLACGPDDAPPVILLPGGGATGTVWWNNVAALAAHHRVYAVDHLGDLGRSVADGRPLRTAGDLAEWLDGIVDELGAPDAAFVGHSYGAWQALTYALHAPGRVRRLVLLDPTDCFTGPAPRYLLHALPVLLAPGAGRWRSLLAWETGGTALDPDWLDLVACNGTVRAAWPVRPTRPDPAALRALDVPALVVLAAGSRAVDVRRAERAAGAAGADVVVLDGQTHHTMPAHEPAALNDAMAAFLAY